MGCGVSRNQIFVAHTTTDSVPTGASMSSLTDPKKATGVFKKTLKHFIKQEVQCIDVAEVATTFVDGATTTVETVGTIMAPIASVCVAELQTRVIDINCTGAATNLFDCICSMLNSRK